MRCPHHVHRDAPARTVTSHGDSAAAHHICAAMPPDISRPIPRKTADGARRALYDRALAEISGGMARRLR
ncbi:hypothetical protein A8H33_02730 [Burkholderia vietnamiensis]|nr:hypothetical protein A8H33_02730 [Burkholderia vietnamiensis]